MIKKGVCYHNMKVISLSMTDNGQYNMPVEVGVMTDIGEGYAWWPDSLDMTTFIENHGCVTLEIARNTVKSYSVNTEALNLYNTQVLADTRNSKITEMSVACNLAIYEGSDVSLSDQTVKHFSFTDKDQINIDGMFEAVKLGASQYLYHADNGDCMMYSAADIVAIYVACKSTVTYHTTYNNSIKKWIKRETDLTTLQNMTYGVELPEDLKTEFNQLIADGKAIIDDLVAKLTEQMSA